MKKIKSYLKRNYKKIIIQVVSLVSALVLFCVPCSAAEYSCEFAFYEGQGSGSMNPGGVYFYTYNYSGGKYHYYPNLQNFGGQKLRTISIDKQYNTVAAIVNQPVGEPYFNSIITNPSEKFYIEFTVFVEFGNVNGALNGNFEAYLSSIDCLVNYENGLYDNYRVDLSIEGWKYAYNLSSKEFTVGFVVSPIRPIYDIGTVSFNFSITNQNTNYYIAFAPKGPIKIKTGDNIPSYALISSAKIDDLENIEKDLQNKTQQGTNEANKIFNNASNVFSETNVLGKSVLAATKIFNSLLKTDVFNDLLNVALTLGIFAFLLGLGGVGASLWDKHENSKYDNISSDDERWLY